MQLDADLGSLGLRRAITVARTGIAAGDRADDGGDVTAAAAAELPPGKTAGNRPDHRSGLHAAFFQFHGRERNDPPMCHLTCLTKICALVTPFRLGFPDFVVVRTRFVVFCMDGASAD